MGARKRPARKNTGSKKEEGILVQKIDIRQVNRGSIDIEKWRNAIQAAESVINPNRRQLYELYHDILLDGHLTSVIGKRLTAITNAKLTFVDKDGEENKILNELIDTEEFEYIVKEILNSRFWGHTLLELDFIPGKIQSELIDRRHVKPEKGIVVKNSTDTNGETYREPPYDNYVLEAGRPKDLGILMKVAQYVIYKRGNYGDWAQYAELFGMPFRKGKYDGYDEVARQNLEQALEKSGSAAYVVLPEGTDVEFEANSSTGDGELYDKLRKACNEEISVAVVGQTLTTTQGDKGARSLGEVHADVADQIHEADKRFVRRILNSRLLPLLEKHGYPVAGGSFTFPEVDKRDKGKKLEMDLKIAKRQPVSDDYFYEEYGVPKPENYDQLKKEQTDAAEAARKQMLQHPKKEEKAALKNLWNFFA